MPQSREGNRRIPIAAAPAPEAKEMIVILGAEQQLAGWNGAAEERFHLSGDTSGARLQEVYRLCWGTPEERSAAFAEAVAGGTWKGRRTALLEGERIDIESSLTSVRDAKGHCVGNVIMLRDVTRQHRLETAQALWSFRVHHALNRAQADMVPICASCKAMRNEADEWTAAEAYLAQRFNLAFTHGICPQCLERLYPNLGQGESASP